MEAGIKLIPSYLCERESFYGSGFHELTMLCAGYVKGMKDSCQGDSGGPLQCQAADGKWRLIGIVSTGDSCALKRKPGLYTRVEAMLSWIKGLITGIFIIIIMIIHTCLYRHKIVTSEQ